MNNKVKSVIVTWSNDCLQIDGVGSFSITDPDRSTQEIPNSGYYLCTSLISGKFYQIVDSQIKLICRKSRKRTASNNY